MSSLLSDYRLVRYNHGVCKLRNGRSSRKDARRRKGSSSRVDSHRGTWYTAINTSTDRLKLMMTKGGRETIPIGDSHADSVTWLPGSNISGGFAAIRTILSHGRCFSWSVSALGQSCLSTTIYLCVYSAGYTRIAYLWQMSCGILRSVHRHTSVHY